MLVLPLLLNVVNSMMRAAVALLNLTLPHSIVVDLSGATRMCDYVHGLFLTFAPAPFPQHMVGHHIGNRKNYDVAGFNVHLTVMFPVLRPLDVNSM